MGNRSENQLDAMLRSVKRRRWQSLVLLCLAVLVAVGVAGIFHHPAIAKTYQVTELTCTAVPPEGAACADYFVHIHNDDCFDANGNLVCPLPEIRPHRHTSDCYSTTRELVCTTPESDGHQHTEDCYTRVRGELICTLSTEPVLDEEGNVLEEGHVHTDECFAWTEELSCGMEEGQGAHHHDENCYVTRTALTCAEPEILLHTHTDDCYQKNEDGSIYVDEDGNTWLICGLLQVLEHVHGPECFTVYELDDGEAGSTENTEGDGSGLVFLFPEEEEEQPAESTNPEAETADSETDTKTDNTAADADKANESENAESTGDSDSTNDTNVNAEGDNQETASGEAAPIVEAPHEVIYTGTRGAEKGGMTVLAEIPEGALDESAQLVLADADESAARKQILKLVNENAAEGEVREISSMLLMDIGFVSGGEPAVMQGADPIRITVRAAAIRGMNAPKLFHLSGGTAQEVKDVLFDTEAGSAVFTGTSFSPFAIVDLTGEETAEEAVGVSMPAQNFTGETDSVIVSVEAPEGAFPPGTTMVISQVEMDDETLSNVTGAVESSGEKKVVTAQAVDISFFDAEGNLIEPKLPIKVSMKSALVSGSENVALVHLAETGAAETAQNDTPEVPAATTAEVVTDVQVVENPDEDNEIQFESDAFSVYVLVGTETITTNYITADGETYTITVTYGPEAMIPAGATLAVAEIPQDSEEYAILLNQAKSAVNAGSTAGETVAASETAEVPAEAAEPPEVPDSSVAAENAESTGGTVDRVSVTTARFFDITILDAEGNPVEPAAPVDVKIEYMEPAETAENYQVVHFGAETEVLNPAVSGTDGTASAFDFQANSFSVFGVVGMKIITMDYITADGETYTITVTYGPEAGIPEGAELVVKELPEETEEYTYYFDQAIESLSEGITEEDYVVGLDYARFFDVSIIKDGQKIEPTAPVEVKITYLDPVELTQDTALKVVHFAESGTEIIEIETTESSVTEIIYEQNGFSVIGTVAVTNANNWPTQNGQYVIVLQNGEEYYAVAQDGSLKRVKYFNDTVSFVGAGTTSRDYINNYLWYFTASGNARGYLSTESGTTGNGRFIDPYNQTGLSTTHRQLRTQNNMVYATGYVDGSVKYYTLSASAGDGGTIKQTDLYGEEASQIYYVPYNSFVANDNESELYTQIDVEGLIEKWRRQMTQDLTVNKTAEVYDYDNRIYRVDIEASSGYYEISPSIALEFVVDCSRSMYFPSKLYEKATYSGYSGLRDWITRNGDQSQVYYFITAQNSAANVFAVYHDGSEWRFADASYYHTQDTTHIGDAGGIYGPLFGNNAGTSYGSYGPITLDRLNGQGFSGVLYTSDEIVEGQPWNRLDYLKLAVEAAAKVVYAVDADAQIGLVKFAATATDLGTWGKEDQNEFYTELRQISVIGGTNPRDGLEEVIQNYTNNSTRQQVVVLVTDGAPNKCTWDEVREKANTLKRQTVAGKQTEIYTLGLSLDNVGTNKQELFSVSSGESYQYAAESGEEIVNCITQIIQDVVIQANLIGDVTDVIDDAFYPVDKNTGRPLSSGDWITLDGIKTTAGSEDAAGQVFNQNGVWSVEWNNQRFDWPTTDSNGVIIAPGWHGSVFVKVKENFLGGNGISTNGTGSKVVAEQFVDHAGNPVALAKEEAERTEALATPYVNVDELKISEESSSWTVYLGTQVDPLAQVKELFNDILISEVVSESGEGHIISADGQMVYLLTPNSIEDGRAEVNSRETFPITDVLSLSEDQWIQLMAGETVPVAYSDYGHSEVGVIEVSLEQTVADGEDDLTPSPHATKVAGSPVETYKLQVTYKPADASVSNYHTGSYGTKRPGNDSDDMESNNTHVINVFSKGLQITKKDQSFRQFLTGAEFTLYRTARTDDDRSMVTTLAGVSGEYFAVETYSVSDAGVMTIDPVKPLEENESYYLVETKAPAGHNLLTEAIPITLTIKNDYTSISGGTPTTVKPEGAYNWIQRAALSMETSNPLVRRFDSSGNDITNSHINAPTLDSETETQYYEIANSSGVELPQTGGEGTLIFSVIGTILILSSTLMILAKRKQETYTPRH